VQQEAEVLKSPREELSEIFAQFYASDFILRKEKIDEI
jgi:hypothetical protein